MRYSAFGNNGQGPIDWKLEMVRKQQTTGYTIERETKSRRDNHVKEYGYKYLTRVSYVES